MDGSSIIFHIIISSFQNCGVDAVAKLADRSFVIRSKFVVWLIVYEVVNHRPLTCGDCNRTQSERQASVTVRENFWEIISFLSSSNIFLTQHHISHKHMTNNHPNIVSNWVIEIVYGDSFCANSSRSVQIFWSFDYHRTVFAIRSTLRREFVNWQVDLLAHRMRYRLFYNWIVIFSFNTGASIYMYIVQCQCSICCWLASLRLVSRIFFHLISNMQTTSEVDTLSYVNIIQASKI